MKLELLDIPDDAAQDEHMREPGVLILELNTVRAAIKKRTYDTYVSFSMQNFLVEDVRNAYGPNKEKKSYLVSCVHQA